MEEEGRKEGEGKEIEESGDIRNMKKSEAIERRGRSREEKRVKERRKEEVEEKLQMKRKTERG